MLFLFTYTAYIILLRHTPVLSLYLYCIHHIITSHTCSFSLPILRTSYYYVTYLFYLFTYTAYIILLRHTPVLSLYLYCIHHIITSHTCSFSLPILRTSYYYVTYVLVIFTYTAYIILLRHIPVLSLYLYCVHHIITSHTCSISLPTLRTSYYYVTYQLVLFTYTAYIILLRHIPVSSLYLYCVHHINTSHTC